MEAAVGHIRQYFGAFEHVFHELASPDIHADICVVTPSALCCWWPPAIIWGAGAVHRGEEPGFWEASSGRPPRIGRGAGVVPVPWGYLVAALTDAFFFQAPLPTDDLAMIGTVGGLRKGLEKLNQLAWQADGDTILGWADTEGYPVDGAIGPEGQYSKADIPEHTQYDTQSLAKFAFSIFWRAIRFAEEQHVPILLDY